MNREDAILLEYEKSQKRIAEILHQNEEYRKIIEARNLKDAEKDYKDRLFKFIFGNPVNKRWTLSLYNAINGTAYTNPDDLEFNTILDVVYMKMKNDASFLIYFEMNLWEHQGSYNPNIPLRFFIYAGALYDKYSITSNYNRFSSVLQKIPRPKCVCFYNGTREMPERNVLKLSDAYDGEGDIEVQVTMVNINYGKNPGLMKSCKPLKEYAWLVDAVRKMLEKAADLDSAIDTAIDEMPDDFEIKGFINGNRAEVKEMFLTEYDEEKTLQQTKMEGFNEGYRGGIDETNARVATDMLQDGKPLAEIIKYSRLTETVVRSIAAQRGIVIA